MPDKPAGPRGPIEPVPEPTASGPQEPPPPTPGPVEPYPRAIAEKDPRGEPLGPIEKLP